MYIEDFTKSRARNRPCSYVYTSCRIAILQLFRLDVLILLMMTAYKKKNEYQYITDMYLYAVSKPLS